MPVSTALKVNPEAIRCHLEGATIPEL